LIFIILNINTQLICFLFSHKNELPELIAVGNNFISKDDNENKSNLLLQDQLNKCNKLIDVLQKENIEQNNEVFYSNYSIFYTFTILLF
jgi:hypothetical protein